jgi:hypothetical protein
MSFWTTGKTALALVSIGILMTPVLRRLGYLPQEPGAVADDAAEDEAQGAAADNAPPEMTLPYGSNGSGETSSRH